MAVKKKIPKKPAQGKGFDAIPEELRSIQSTAGSFFGQYGRGFRFTPTAWNPDDLVQKKGIKIYRTMLTDEQIKSALLAKKYAVLSTGYEIVPPDVDEEDEETEDEFAEFQDDNETKKTAIARRTEEIAKFVEFNFEEMEGSFDSKILDLLTAIEFGFSVSEKIFGLIDYGPFNGKIVLRDLLTRPPDDIEFRINALGRLVEDGVLQFNNPLPRDKFVIYSYRKTFGNVYGSSDLREAYRAWWSKDNMLKLLAISLERYGAPVATVTYEGTLTAAQKAEIDEFLKNLQTRSGIRLPKNVELAFHSPPPRTAEAFIPAINLYDQHLRIAVLLPGLLGLSGESQTGSFARAVKEFDVFLWVLGQLRKDIETTINEQIIKPLCDMNYEIEHGKYPKFRFKAVTEEIRQRQFELFITGLSTGALVKGPEDENKLRDLIDWSPLPEGFEPPQPESPFPPSGDEEGSPDSEEEEEGEFFFENSRLAKYITRLR